MTVDWSTEWLSSLLWIAVVTVLALLGSAIVLALVTRLTRWGRQFRRLAYPYFAPRGGQVVSSQGGRRRRYRGCIGGGVQRGEGAAWASRSRAEFFSALLGRR